MSTNSRLEELLDIRDGEIAELRARLEKFEEEKEEKRERSTWKWAKHFRANDHPKLPLPRLEITCRPDDPDEATNWYNYTWTYCLVYEHLVGDIIHVPLGSTRCNGGGQPPISLPFRDGAHIIHDMKHLDLPAFRIIGNEAPILITENTR